MNTKKLDKDGICTDYKNRLCYCCAHLNTEVCSRCSPKYQKRIESWKKKLAMARDSVVSIDRSIEVLRSARNAVFEKVSQNDAEWIRRMVEAAKQKPGSGIRFMHDGKELSCFSCVHCEKKFNDEPCRTCFRDDEPTTGVVHDCAHNFTPKSTDREDAIRELAQRYYPVIDELVKEAKSSEIPTFGVAAYLLQYLGEKSTQLK